MISNIPLISHEMIIAGALMNMSRTGGDASDAMAIEAHFGRMGSWVDEVIRKCNSGLCTDCDVKLVEKYLAATV